MVDVVDVDVVAALGGVSSFEDVVDVDVVALGCLSKRLENRVM